MAPKKDIGVKVDTLTNTGLSLLKMTIKIPQMSAETLGKVLHYQLLLNL